MNISIVISDNFSVRERLGNILMSKANDFLFTLPNVLTISFEEKKICV